MATTASLADLAERELAAFAGELIAPGDAEYDDARKVHNAMIDRRPALIARSASPDDVAAAVSFATRHDALLAVRGGHNGGGLGIADDAVVIEFPSAVELLKMPEAERGYWMDLCAQDRARHGVRDVRGIRRGRI